jgi:hypothetical protein
MAPMQHTGIIITAITIITEAGITGIVTEDVIDTETGTEKGTET